MNRFRVTIPILNLLVLWSITTLLAYANPTEWPYGGEQDTTEPQSYAVNFKSDADFVKAEFTNNAVFLKAKFEQNADFTEAHFKIKSFFRESQFAKGAFFDRTTFEEDVGFMSAHFNRYAGFSQATFIKEAKFGSVIFDSVACFNNSKFLGYADFGRAKFFKDALFSNTYFKEISDFESALFNGDCDFVNSNFERIANFSSDTFNGKANFSNDTFNQYANFSDTIFNGNANFSFVNFENNAYFDNCSFNKDLRIDGARFIEGVDLRRTNFSDSSSIFFDYTTYFPNGKLNANWKQLKGRLHHTGGYSTTAKYYSVTEIFYQRLRDNYLAQNDRASADAVMYELAKRKAEILNEPLWVFYGWTMGWGYKPLRFLFATFLLVVLPFARFWYIWYYHRVLPLVDNSISETLKERLTAHDTLKEKYRFLIFRVKFFNHSNIAKEVSLPARIWHVLFFSTSVLLGIRFKKEWIEKNDRAFLLWVTAEWLMGIVLYVTFTASVKSYEFGYVKGLLGF